jgi:hypothetical protein
VLFLFPEIELHERIAVDQSGNETQNSEIKIVEIFYQLGGNGHASNQRSGNGKVGIFQLKSLSCKRLLCL